TNWDKFERRLAELPTGQPIVIFLDTLEEASLHHPRELRDMIRRFQRLKAAVPEIRLVLSGRYQLGQEHLQRLIDTDLAAALVSCELKPFNDTYAGDFVRRRLPRAVPDMVAAVVNSANGFPFKLALLSELVLDDDTLTAEKLANYREADVAYVIQRVIKRIPQQGLRWVVRYGAVARRL